MCKIKLCSICQHFYCFVNYSGLLSHLQLYKLMETFLCVYYCLKTPWVCGLVPSSPGRARLCPSPSSTHESSGQARFFSSSQWREQALSCLRVWLPQLHRAVTWSHTTRLWRWMSWGRSENSLWSTQRYICLRKVPSPLCRPSVQLVRKPAPACTEVNHPARPAHGGRPCACTKTTGNMQGPMGSGWPTYPSHPHPHTVAAQRAERRGTQAACHYTRESEGGGLEPEVSAGTLTFLSLSFLICKTRARLPFSGLIRGNVCKPSSPVRTHGRHPMKGSSAFWDANVT